jgi:hypothetical protein
MADIGWIVLAFLIGSGFGAIVGVGSAVRIASLSDGSRPNGQVK